FRAAGRRLRERLRGHPTTRAGGAAHARAPGRPRRDHARQGARADDRMVQATVALRVDVDTRRGLEEGAPRLLELFRRRDLRATFFVTMGPDRSGRALRRALRPSFLRKMWRTNPFKLYGLRTLLSATFLPAPLVADGVLATLQVPTTMPTMDELLGRVPDIPGTLLQAVRPGLNVFTLHAEVEGGHLLTALEAFLDALGRSRVRFARLDDVVDRLR